MKQLLIQSIILYFVTGAIAQEGQQVLKSDLVLKQPFKAPYETTFINPIDFNKKLKRKGKDTLTLYQPFASRFYPDLDSLPKDLNDQKIYRFLKYQRIPTEIDILDIIQPFFIANHEVTNNEYRMFLNSLSEKGKLQNYPDTSRWVLDFNLVFNEPLKLVYFAHPKYDNYPVVGVTFFQAKAFCKWLEKRLNDLYNTNGYELTVDLPNQFEWAFANGDKYVWLNTLPNPYFDNQFFDKDYITDLKIDGDSSSFNLLNSALLPGYANTNTAYMSEDGYMYTTPYSKVKKKASRSMVHQDNLNNVQFINTNVSEWCSETYQDNWKDLFLWRQNALRSIGTSDAVMTAEIEKYYNSFNDTINGRLVRGGNWLYEHHAMRHGQNVGMHDAKLFVDPNKSHSTIGFRYVIRYQRKQEHLSD